MSRNYCLKLIKETNHLSLFSKDEEYKLIKIYQDALNLENIDINAEKINKGNKAKDELVLRNLKLVYSIVLENNFFELDNIISDLFNAGVIGLIKAINKFDLKKNNRLSTYSYYWIKGEVLEELSKLKNKITIPKRTREMIIKIKQVQNELKLELDCDPTPFQIAERLNMKEEDVKKNLDFVYTFTNLDVEVQSMTNTPHEEYTKVQKEIEVGNLLNMLPNFDQKIICYKYGLKGYEHIDNNAEIARLLNTNRERVRLVIKNTLSLFREKYIGGNI